jgi:predicted nucleic acid-binding protein
MKKYKIYLDNCCFNRPFDDQEQLKIFLETKAKLFIQEQILNGKYELIWSFILTAENEANYDFDKKNKIKNWIKKSNYYIKCNKEIEDTAEEINIKTGIHAKDSIHIACALFAKADFFITTDKKILKNSKIIKKIKFLNPIDFIEILDEVNYEN